MNFSKSSIGKQNKVSDATENRRLELEERRIALEEGKLAMERNRTLSSEAAFINIAESQKESNLMMMKMVNGMMQGMQGMIEFMKEKNKCAIIVRDIVFKTSFVLLFCYNGSANSFLK